MGKRFDKEELENYGIEITNVSSFIDEINSLKNELPGSNEELFFRGQKNYSWDVTPSIFRDNYLSVEHILMQEPLLKSPYEFISINNDFEIMTKYQHYGMCTRLLDLTTNPLVALYFACEENYDNEENQRGAIFFNKGYTNTYTREIKIITALSKMDLSQNETVENVLKNLRELGIITKELEEKWKSKEKYNDFIQKIQNNYIVTPPYNNERLSRQSGMFLLAGCFNFINTENIAESRIEKGYKDLRDEFDKRFFYISEENKKKILDELDTYNINESTLFPELEHQLSYIKNKKNSKTKSSSEFTKFNFNDVEHRIIKKDIKIDDDIIKNEKLKENVIKEFKGKYKFDIEQLWMLVEKWISTVDWSIHESYLSEFKVGVKKILSKNGFNKENADKEAENISKLIIIKASELSKGNKEK